MNFLVIHKINIAIMRRSAHLLLILNAIQFSIGHIIFSFATLGSLHGLVVNWISCNAPFTRASKKNPLGQHTTVYSSLIFPFIIRSQKICLINLRILAMHDAKMSTFWTFCFIILLIHNLSKIWISLHWYFKATLCTLTKLADQHLDVAHLCTFVHNKCP